MVIVPVYGLFGVMVKFDEALFTLPDTGPENAYVLALGRLGVTAVDAADGLELPAELVATTVKVYAVPLVRPVTVIGDAEPVPVSDPGLEVTVYPVMVEPPLDIGGVKLTVACAFPAVADTPVGAPGTVAIAV
jgi:hypothetical protein